MREPKCDKRSLQHYSRLLPQVKSQWVQIVYRSSFHLAVQWFCEPNWTAWKTNRTQHLCMAIFVQVVILCFTKLLHMHIWNTSQMKESLLSSHFRCHKHWRSSDVERVAGNSAAESWTSGLAGSYSVHTGSDFANRLRSISQTVANITTSSGFPNSGISPLSFLDRCWLRIRRLSLPSSFLLSQNSRFLDFPDSRISQLNQGCSQGTWLITSCF